ncbi:carbohydrate-binding domain-containing protein [Paenibacillus mesotrionivorans]|uniref:Carbohydrate-binding domain-containing protein n=1 Tax=Paenibacillus mesotrionivorans TaxID=3160968 RepID=A0ACC7P578_9BACL
MRMRLRSTSFLLAGMLTLSSVLFSPVAGAASPTETLITLSDRGIQVDGQTASSDSSSAVYTGADIVYYKAGQGSAYGEGTAEDEHAASEAEAHTVVTITEPGTYRVSGTLSAGQLAVDLGKDAAEDPSAVVKLILDGVNITSTVAPAVIFYNVYEPYSSSEDTKGVTDLSSAGAQVVIADGSDNHVSGSYVARIYKEGTTKKLHKYDGAFYSKMSMNISGESAGTGKLTILAENEGLDSELHLTLNGGSIYIESQDDGINTNEDGISVTTINGGYLHVNAGLGAEGDGIDSNGYLTVNGGSIVTMSNERSPDGGIDADKDILLNGGMVVALGTRNDATSGDSKQPFMELMFASTQAAGSVIEITDASGNKLLNHTAEKAFQSITFTSADLALNQEYQVYVDGIRQQYSGNSFGMMGGPPGGGGRPQGTPPGQGQGTPPAGNGNGTPPEPPAGEKPAMPDGMTPPGMNGFPDGQAETAGEASTSFILTDTVHSFSAITASTDASGKQKVTFSINAGRGIANAASGGTIVLDSITASTAVPDMDVQVTVTDVPSENYSETALLSEGIEAISAILPKDDGTYRLTVAVVSGNAAYTGATSLQFTIGGLPFADVKLGDGAYDAIKSLYEKGVMVGTAENAFSPNEGLSRAAAVTVFGRLLDVKPEETALFSDVEQSSWYSGYVGWAAEAGLVEGIGNGQFSPNSIITADRMNLIMERYSALSGQTYQKAEGGSKPLTRGEFAVMLVSLKR